jgi:hypothetical protein
MVDRGRGTGDVDAQSAWPQAYSGRHSASEFISLMKSMRRQLAPDTYVKCGGGCS